MVGRRRHINNIGGKPGNSNTLAHEGREGKMSYRASQFTLRMSTAVALALLATASVAEAQALRDKWCSDVHIRFFVGGAEGDAFGTIVYNGARQAAADTGAQVDYVFSGWAVEKMVQQLREAVAAKPNGIAMMGHPGDDSIMPLAEEASKNGIKMMYQNVPVPKVVAAFGGGYVGAQQEAQGRALGVEAVKLGGLKSGDTAIVLGPFDNENRGARERGTVAAMEEAGVTVVKINSPPEWAADPNLAIPVITAAILNSPEVKAIGYPGGQMLGNVPTYMQAAGKNAGDIFNFGFDTSPQIVEAFKGGWVQLTADQQPFQQGYLPILSLCEQVVYGLAPIDVDTGAGFVTPENYEMVAKLAAEALR
jgi:simple sugar transport system substrate-binding protein